MPRWQRSLSMLSVVLEAILLLDYAYASNSVSAEGQTSLTQYISRPDIESPQWLIETHDWGAVQKGMYWFVSPYDSFEQKEYPRWNGPLIYDDQGGLIWSGAPDANYVNIFDFRKSVVDGREMLSYVLPKDRPRGNGIILDDSYEVYKTVDMKGNHSTWNMHEFNLINDGKTALMAVPQDYTATYLDVDGYSGTCKIGWQGFKEVNVGTNKVIFEWSTRAHIRPEESTYVPKHTNNTWVDKCAQDWDITHINAVDKFPDGDYLFSARHTDALYKVSHRNHSIVWRLGGVFSDFVFKDQRARFTRQHHARIVHQNESHTYISLFDNAVGSGSSEERSSVGSWALVLLLRTDIRPMTVDIVARYEKPLTGHEHNFSPSRGSLSFLPNGNAFVGWVLGSHIAEYTSDGRLLQTAIFPSNSVASYRSYKFSWSGRPARPPDAVADHAYCNANHDTICTIVHVSWNGATGVTLWNILRSGANGNNTRLVASSPRKGFETQIVIDKNLGHIVAVALNLSGHEIGRSKVVTPRLSMDLQSTNLVDETVERLLAQLGPGVLWIGSVIPLVLIWRSIRGRLRSRHFYRVLNGGTD